MRGCLIRSREHLHDHDAREHDAGTDDLHHPERLTEPRPRDCGRDDRLAHRDDAGRRRSSTTHAIGTHSGTLNDSSDPSIDASFPSTEKSNVHHGLAIAQITAESANIQNVRVIG